MACIYKQTLILDFLGCNLIIMIEHGPKYILVTEYFT